MFSAKVEHWSIERLIPHARNARTHSEAQVAQIAGSIAEFGFVKPVLVGDDGVIDGRVLAARRRSA
jgi:ParB-like chromosome segregation protein Spo0J